MVNWQEAGKTWPLPQPRAVYLLRGLVWGQQYRHSNPQCKGGMPGSFELREDMGADRLQAVEDWQRVVTRSRGGPGHGTLRRTRTREQAGKALRSQGHPHARVM